MLEQRQGPRVALADPMAVANPDTGAQVGLILNLSRDGFMLIADAAFHPEQIYRFRAPLGADGGNIDFEAACLWCQRSSYSEQYGAGFTLRQRPQALDDAITRLLAR